MSAFPELFKIDLEYETNCGKSIYFDEEYGIFLTDPPLECIKNVQQFVKVGRRVVITIRTKELYEELYEALPLPMQHQKMKVKLKGFIPSDEKFYAKVNHIEFQKIPIESYEETVNDINNLLSSESNHLQILDLSNNLLRVAHISTLMIDHEHARHLKELLLRDNLITELEFRSFCQKVARSQIEKLELSFNILGVEAAKIISESILTVPNNNLKFLILKAHSSNELKNTDYIMDQFQLGDEGMKYIADALVSKHCKLTLLDIENQNIGVSGAKSLSNSLMHKDCTIEHLFLSFNSLGCAGTEYLATAFESPNCKVRTVDLCQNEIKAIGMKALSAALSKKGNSITALDLSLNYFKDQEPYVTYSFLDSPNCLITTLNLGGNFIGEDGAEYLSSILSKANSKLVKLGLYSNELGNEGIKHLAGALRSKHCSLKSLSVDFNEITSPGIVDLTSALQGNSKLVHLDLSGNGEAGYTDIGHVSETAYESLFKLLDSSSLSYLKLGSIEFDSTAVSLMANYITQYKRRPITLDIRYNKMDKDLYLKLENSIKKSKKAQVIYDHRREI